MPAMDERTGYGQGYRHVPFITLSELKHRAWITLSGCNFTCKGCFSIARDPVGEPMTVEQLINLVNISSRKYYGDTALEEVVITGGEPTLNRGFLLDLTRNLKMRVGSATHYAVHEWLFIGQKLCDGIESDRS